jgi:hypothetical protein
LLVITDEERNPPPYQTEADRSDELWKLNHYHQRLDDREADRGIPKSRFARPPADPMTELHNRSADPEVRHNRVDDAPDQVSRLTSILDTRPRAGRQTPAPLVSQPCGLHTVDRSHVTEPTRPALSPCGPVGVPPVRKLRGRPRADGGASMPKWMDGIAGFAPGKSLAVGVAVGALNPKNVAVGLAAALSIASAELSTGRQLGCLAVYAFVAFVAVLGVATPMVVTLVLGDRAQEAGRFSR